MSESPSVPLASQALPDSARHQKVDHWRQLAIFNPLEFEHTVHVVGVGATGSHFADTIACMGVDKIVAYDPDKVEAHNLPNQAFHIQHIGQPKSVALKELIASKTGIQITAKEERVEKIDKLQGVLVLCTDSMDAQKSICLVSARLNERCPLVIETRMGLEQGRIYAFDPRNRVQLQKWIETCYSDKEAAESPCNARAIGTTAKTIAAMAAHKLVTWYLLGKGSKTDLRWANETLLAMDGSVMSNAWS